MMHNLPKGCNSLFAKRGLTAKGRNNAFVFLLFLFSLLSSHFSKAQYYNGSYLNYGRSRVQYYTDKFVWSFYRFEKYDVYFYTGGKNLAEYTARYAQKRLPEIERLLNIENTGRIQFVVYNRQSHFIQSNVGLNTESAEQNATEVSPVQGQKVFVYFDGNHANLEKQISEGIARVLFNNFMFGNSLRERLRYMPVNNIPEWYTEGLFAYAASPWSVEDDNKMRAAMRNPRFFKLSKLSGKDSRLAGLSIWNFIAQNYGENIISKIVYMTKMGRSANNGFVYILGLNINALTAEWINFYDKQYPPAEDSLRVEAKGFDSAPFKKDRKYYGFTMGQNNTGYDTYYAYVVNRMGRYKVYIDYIKLNHQAYSRPVKVYKGGDRIEQAIDASYPLLTWAPGDSVLTMLVEKKGELWLIDYHTQTKQREQKPVYHFDKITAMQYMPNGQDLLLSAVRDGITDLYIYNRPSNTYKPLTNDKPDDLTPLYFNNAVVFSSNRNNDTLKPKQPQHLVAPYTDLFRLPLQNNTKVLQRITYTPQTNEYNPIVFDSAHIAFIGELSGIPNRYTAKFDSVLASIDTTEHYRFTSEIASKSNYRFSLLEQSSNSTGNAAALLFSLDKCAYGYITDKQDDSTTATPVKTYYAKNGRDTTWKKYKNIPGNERIKVFEDDTSKKDNSIDINNYEFEDEKGKRKKEALPPLSLVDTTIITDTFRLPKQRIYLTSFYTEGFNAKFDRNFINQGYQPFSPGGYNNPSINGLIKIQLRDVMEDYRITGAFRLSTTLVGNEYLVRIENLKHRLDRELILHRMGVQQGFDNTRRDLIHQIIGGVRYPFMQTLWVKGQLLGRMDRTVFTGATENTLKRPNEFAYWGALNTEAVYDNTVRAGTNILFGTRIKAWAEFYYRFDKKKNNTTVIGVDFRHYLPIHRTFILAIRAAASTSFGAGKLMYYMGGVDGAIIPRIDNDANIDNTQRYLFQALANGVRGFGQNVRNGNTFVMASAELRFPLFKYLLNTNVRSEVLNSFQLTAFFDAGSAYVGLNPYSETNTLETNNIQQGPLNIVVKTQREPFIAGFGGGLRTKIMGYFLRADFARGIENGNVGKLKFYLSVGTDF